MGITIEYFSRNKVKRVCTSLAHMVYNFKDNRYSILSQILEFQFRKESKMQRLSTKCAETRQ